MSILLDSSGRLRFSNPVLDDGTVGHETDTGKEKIGDGETAWNDLPYKASKHSGPFDGLVTVASRTFSAEEIAEGWVDGAYGYVEWKELGSDFIFYGAAVTQNSLVADEDAEWGGFEQFNAFAPDADPADVDSDGTQLIVSASVPDNLGVYSSELTNLFDSANIILPGSSVYPAFYATDDPIPPVAGDITLLAFVSKAS